MVLKPCIVNPADVKARIMNMIFSIVVSNVPSRNYPVIASHVFGLCGEAISYRVGDCFSRCRSLAMTELKQLQHFLSNFKQINRCTVMRHVEDRRFLICIDRDDQLGAVHTFKMFRRAGDTQHEI